MKHESKWAAYLSNCTASDAEAIRADAAALIEEVGQCVELEDAAMLINRIAVASLRRGDKAIWNDLMQVYRALDAVYTGGRYYGEATSSTGGDWWDEKG